MPAFNYISVLRENCDPPEDCGPESCVITCEDLETCGPAGADLASADIEIEFSGYSSDACDPGACEQFNDIFLHSAPQSTLAGCCYGATSGDPGACDFAIDFEHAWCIAEPAESDSGEWEIIIIAGTNVGAGATYKLVGAPAIAGILVLCAGGEVEVPLVDDNWDNGLGPPPLCVPGDTAIIRSIYP